MATKQPKQVEQDKDLSSQITLFPETAPNVTTENIPTGLISGGTFGADPTPDLIASIKAVGILIPLIVQKGENERYVLVDGRRRLKAAREAKINLVPCRILESSVLNPEVYTLQANMTRRANPISEFVAIRELVSRGYPEAEISKTLGIKSAVIQKRMLLAKLTPTFFDLVEGGNIAVSIGERVAKLPPSLQEALVSTFASNGDKLSSKDVQAARIATETANKTESLSDAIFGENERKKAAVEKGLAGLKDLSEAIEILGIQASNFAEAAERLEALLDK